LPDEHGCGLESKAVLKCYALTAATKSAIKKNKTNKRKTEVGNFDQKEWNN